MPAAAEFRGYPREVIKMSENGVLSEVLVEKWSEAGHENPLSAALQCVENKQWWIFCAAVSGIVTAIAVAFVSFGPWGIDPEEVNFSVLLIGLMTLVMLAIKASEPAQTFHDEGFGGGFRDLCTFLKLTPEELLPVPEDRLRALVGTASREAAREVKEADMRDVEHFMNAGSEKDAYACENARRQARALFCRMIEVFGSFGLVDSKDWPSFFKA